MGIIVKAKTHWAWILFGVVVAVVTARNVVPAQENPFGIAVEDAAPVDLGVESEDAAERPAIPPGAGSVVEAVVESDPQTPEQLVRAADVLLRLEQPELSKFYLAKLLAEQVDDQVAVALADDFGSDVFYRFKTRREVQPEGTQVADLVFDARQRQLSDRKTIEGWVNQLSAESVASRQAALQRLLQARSAAVDPLLDVLADPDRKSEHPEVRGALIALGSDAVGPLVATLESDDSQTMIAAIQTLAAIGQSETAKFLLGPFASSNTPETVRDEAGAALFKLAGGVPETDTAALLLATRASDYFYRDMTIGRTADGRTTVWQWDAGSEAPIASTIPEDEARFRLAARLINDAHAILPDDDDIQLLRATILAEVAGTENEAGETSLAVDSPAARAVESLDERQLERMLLRAMETRHAMAATAALRRLVEVKEDDELLFGDPKGGILVRAARHPDRRIRIAALKALIDVGGEKPFPGSSAVVTGLKHFAASRGQATVVVGATSVAEGRQVAGYLIPMGYQVEVAHGGRETFRTALSSPDVAMILIDSRVFGPRLDILLQQLKQDYRTADIPIGVIARGDHEGRARTMAEAADDVIVVPRPHDAESVRWIVDRVKGLGSPARMSDEQRLAQANWALGALDAYALDRPTAIQQHELEAIAAAAVQVPALRDRALAMLGRLNAPAAQRTLVDLASRKGREIPVRQEALDQFVHNVQQHGILLTTREILDQYERCNAEKSDVESRKILNAILDCIEAGGAPSAAFQAAPVETDAPAPRGDAT